MHNQEKDNLLDSLNHSKRFFGRRKAKALSPLQKDLYIKAQSEIFFNLENCQVSKTLFDNSNADLILEIGFGRGEHLLHQAEINPHINYLGIDAYVNSVSKAIKQVYQNNLTNIRLSDEDAFNCIKLFPDNSLNGIYLLYPDPWPKKYHRNRRFMQRDTAMIIERILKPNGFFCFASDIPAYVEWTIANLINSTSAYMNINQRYNIPFENWISTYYEQKALKEGRQPAYYQFFFNKN
jgi:tRNA (guanine-N7-)-methyltransferase